VVAECSQRYSASMQGNTSSRCCTPMLNEMQPFVPAVARSPHTNIKERLSLVASMREAIVNSGRQVLQATGLLVARDGDGVKVVEGLSPLWNRDEAGRLQRFND
jgi:hypothetical protein